MSYHYFMTQELNQQNLINQQQSYYGFYEKRANVQQKASQIQRMTYKQYLADQTTSPLRITQNFVKHMRSNSKTNRDRNKSVLGHYKERYYIDNQNSRRSSKKSLTSPTKSVKTSQSTRPKKKRNNFRVRTPNTKIVKRIKDTHQDEPVQRTEPTSPSRKYYKNDPLQQILSRYRGGGEKDSAITSIDSRDSKRNLMKPEFSLAFQYRTRGASPENRRSDRMDNLQLQSEYMEQQLKIIQQPNIKNANKSKKHGKLSKNLRQNEYFRKLVKKTARPHRMLIQKEESQKSKISTNTPVTTEIDLTPLQPPQKPTPDKTKQIKKLQSQLLEKDNLLLELKSKNNKIQKKLSEQIKTNKKLRIDKEQISNQLKEQAQILEKQFADINNSWQIREQQIKKFKEQINELGNKNKNFVGKNEGLEKQIQSQRLINQKLQQDKQQLSNKLQEYTQLLENQRNNGNKIQETSFKTLQQENTQLNTQLNDLIKTNTQLNNQNKSLQTEIQDQSKTHDELCQDLNTLSEKVKQCQSILEHSEKVKEQEKLEREKEKETQQKENQLKINDLQRLIQGINAQNDQLTKEIKQQREINTTISTDKQQLFTELQEYTQLYENEYKENEQNKDLTQKLNNMQRQVVLLKNRNIELETKNVELQKACLQYQKQSQMSIDEEDQKEKNALMEKEISRLQLQINDLIKTNKHIQSLNSSLLKQNAHQMKENQKLQKEKNAQTQNIKDIPAQMLQLRSNNKTPNEVQVQNNKFICQINTLQKKLTDLKEKQQLQENQQKEEVNPEELALTKENLAVKERIENQFLINVLQNKIKILADQVTELWEENQKLKLDIQEKQVQLQRIVQKMQRQVHCIQDTEKGFAVEWDKKIQQMESLSQKKVEKQINDLLNQINDLKNQNFMLLQTNSTLQKRVHSWNQSISENKQIQQQQQECQEEQTEKLQISLKKVYEKQK